jgi:hypothetical protein
MKGGTTMAPLGRFFCRGDIMTRSGRRRAVSAAVSVLSRVYDEEKAFRGCMPYSMEDGAAYAISDDSATMLGTAIPLLKDAYRAYASPPCLERASAGKHRHGTKAAPKKRCAGNPGSKLAHRMPARPMGLVTRRRPVRSTARLLAQAVGMGGMAAAGRNGLRDWLMSGNSFNDNPFGICGEDGRPIDYVRAYIITEEMLAAPGGFSWGRSEKVAPGFRKYGRIPF